MTNAKRNSRNTKSVNVFHFQYVHNGKELYVEQPVIEVKAETLSTLITSDKEIDQAIIGALFTGSRLPYNSGAELRDAINAERKAKKLSAITKDDIKAAYDKFQLVKQIREITTEPLQAAWDTFTAQKMNERAERNAENAKLKAANEPTKSNIKVMPPTVSGILKMLKPVEQSDDLELAVKYMTQAYNKFLNMKGKQAEQDAAKLAAIIVSNGGTVNG